MGMFRDLTGERFTRLTILHRAKGSYLGVRWLCRCDCGRTTRVRTHDLLRGASRSCGCLRKDVTPALRHGESRYRSVTREYGAWSCMRTRCNNPASVGYENYGGRGITVCRRWDSYEIFLQDMGRCPPGYSLDRINVNRGYSQANCRWATRLQQHRNTRANKLLTVAGRTQCLAAWVVELGIPRGTISSRLREGWTEAEALSTHRYRRYLKREDAMGTSHF